MLKKGYNGQNQTKVGLKLLNDALPKIINICQNQTKVGLKL